MKEIKRITSESYSKKIMGYCGNCPDKHYYKYCNSSKAMFSSDRYVKMVDDDDYRVHNVFRCDQCKELIEDTFIEFKTFWNSTQHLSSAARDFLESLLHLPLKIFR